MAGQVDEIKARVDIVDLVSEYIRLKPAGTNNWRALCPFHNEKSPSFMVSRDKQIFHCFGCSEGGDIFTFVQKMEGLDFPESLRLLAQKAGVKLETQDPKLASKKNRLMDICATAQGFWQSELADSKEGEIARDYLVKRGVAEKTIAEFKLGYAADSWDRLTNFLKSKKFTDSDIFLAGLSVKKDRGDGFYDRFRCRLVFPINDMHGNPIGFSARTLKADEQGGKYINTPQTLIYNKSLAIFNIDKAKVAIKKSDYVIVVEGQMDALSAFAAGTENVIATSGTAFTLDQIRLLKRYTNNMMIAFDTDAAGQSAARRGIDLALGEEMNVKMIVLPQGKDPDECIKTDVKLWFDAIKHAKSIVQYYFDQTFASVNVKEVEGKKQAAKVLLPVLGKITNAIEQTHWLQELSSALNVPENILRQTLNKTLPKQTTSNQANPQAASKPFKTRDQLLAERILAIVLKYPINITHLIDNLAPETITNKLLTNLYKALIIYYTTNINSDVSAFDYQAFKASLKPDGLDGVADQLVLLAEKDFFDFDQEAIRAELFTAINFCKRSYYAGQLKDLEERIKQAENSKDVTAVTSLSEQFNQVISQLNTLED